MELSDKCVNTDNILRNDELSLKSISPVLEKKPTLKIITLEIAVQTDSYKILEGSNILKLKVEKNLNRNK